MGFYRENNLVGAFPNQRYIFKISTIDTDSIDSYFKKECPHLNDNPLVVGVALYDEWVSFSGLEYEKITERDCASGLLMTGKSFKSHDGFGRVIPGHFIVEGLESCSPEEFSQYYKNMSDYKATQNGSYVVEKSLAIPKYMGNDFESAASNSNFFLSAEHPSRVNDTAAFYL